MEWRISRPLYWLYNAHIPLAVSNSAPPENEVESEERKKKKTDWTTKPSLLLCDVRNVNGTNETLLTSCVIHSLHCVLSVLAIISSLLFSFFFFYFFEKALAQITNSFYLLPTAVVEGKGGRSKQVLPEGRQKVFDQRRCKRQTSTSTMHLDADRAPQHANERTNERRVQHGGNHIPTLNV